MNIELRELLVPILRHPIRYQDQRRFELTMRARSLNPTDEDFSDELFESFSPDLRERLYKHLILIVDKKFWRPIAKRRAIFETDRHCMMIVETMMKALGETT